MAYERVNFSSYEDLTRDIDRDYELDDRTMRGMIHAEHAAFFELLGKIVATYAAAKDEQKLVTFFAMVEDGCNDVIELLAGRTGGK